MHSANDENYNRGYEWWLMTEAKKVRIQTNKYNVMFEESDLFKFNPEMTLRFLYPLCTFVRYVYIDQVVISFKNTAAKRNLSC